MSVRRFIVCFALGSLLFGMAPAVAGASPPPPTAREIAQEAQAWSYGYFPKESGEFTNCTYRKKRMETGYHFTCFLFNKSKTEIGHVDVVTLAPHGGKWYFQYTVS